MESFELGKELEKDVFRPVTRVRHIKDLNPHEESNLRPSGSALRCSTTEPQIRWARSITTFIAQNLPFLLFYLKTLLYRHMLIQAVYKTVCLENFVIDLAYSRISVAQWWRIEARNPKVWGSIPYGDSEFFLCPTLLTRRKIFLYI